MAEYIKREAAINAIVDARNRYYNSASNQYLVGRCDGLDIAAGLLRVAPTADVAPVVRCKDCRCFERQGEYNGGISYGYCYHWDYEQGGEPNMVDGNDFCSYGEKKDGADHASG